MFFITNFKNEATFFLIKDISVFILKKFSEKVKRKLAEILCNPFHITFECITNVK